MDVQSLFESQFEALRKQDKAKYFLMRVEEVRGVRGKPDHFIAYGTRVDNDQYVAVASTKSSAGQHLPQSGSVLRADKVSRLTGRANDPDRTYYSAEYFHAYLNDAFCARAIVQAQPPKKDAQTGIWSADVRMFDVEEGPVVLDGTQIASSIEKELERMLTPWKWSDQTSITHDVKGDALWGDGSSAKPGLSPFVAVRSGSKTFYVYGSGAIRVDDGKNDTKQYALPNQEKVKELVGRNSGLQNLMQVIRSVAAQATPEQMKSLKVTLIPGLQVRVGRDSVGGEKQSYLAVPGAFDWKRNDQLDENNRPTTQPGYRLADLHIKTSRTGAMMVVDAAPAAGGRLTQFIPETRPEREIRLAAETSQAQQQSPQPRAEQPQRQAQPARQQPEADTRPAPQARGQQSSTSNYDAPARNSYDDDMDDGMDDFGSMEEFDTYASDLAMMQELQHQPEPQPQSQEYQSFDDDLDSLMNEAAQRQAQRGPRPGM